jgi:hypothetical protein
LALAERSLEKEKIVKTISFSAIADVGDRIGFDGEAATPYGNTELPSLSGKTTATVQSVTKSEVGPNVYGIFYLIETDAGDHYELEEIEDNDISKI